MDTDLTEIPTPWLICRWRNRHAFDEGTLALVGGQEAMWRAVCPRCGTTSELAYLVTRGAGGRVKQIRRMSATPTYVWTEDYQRLMRLVTSADAGQEVLRRQLEGEPRRLRAAQ